MRYLRPSTPPPNFPSGPNASPAAATAPHRCAGAVDNLPLSQRVRGHLGRQILLVDRPAARWLAWVDLDDLPAMQDLDQLAVGPSQVVRTSSRNGSQLKGEGSLPPANLVAVHNVGMDRPIPTFEEMSRALFDAWRSGPDWEDSLRLLREIPVPGSVALRGRFHLLTDVTDHQHDRSAFGIEWDLWCQQVQLTEAADASLVAHELSEARALAHQLIDASDDDRHPLPRIDAMVALGDAARQGDDFTSAAQHYDEALELAEASGYRFGRLRALVAVGYLTLQAGSAEQAALRFRQAAGLAADLDDRVYRANALAGRGEALARLRQFDSARSSLGEALALFQSIRSDGGVITAAQHLGDLHRRQRNFEDALRYLELACETATRSGQWLGLVNAADSLGEVHLGRGDLVEAVRHFETALGESAARGDSRGIAHAINGLGRCAAADQNWDVAETLHQGALARYRQLEDSLSATSALDGIARAAAGRGDQAKVVGALVDAVEEVESMRSAQQRHRYQQELRFRFAPMYRSALRAAVAADDPTAFTTVFEALAGRRLAALIDRAAHASEAELAGQLLATAHQRPIAGADLDRSLDAATRRAQLLGRLSLRHGLPDIARKDLDDVTAALYTPVRRVEAGELLRRASRRSRVLLVTQLPGSDDTALLLSGPKASPRMWISALPPATIDALANISAEGLIPTARAGDVVALHAMLPDELRREIGTEEPLLIVPLDRLWAIPWPALITGGGLYLGETTPLAVAPSLTVANRAASVGEKAPRPNTVAHWRNPALRYHQLVAFDDDSRVTPDPLRTAAQARDALTRCRHDLVVVAGHGRPLTELGHYLELDDQTLLMPTDLLVAEPPTEAALVSCWGAVAPGAPDGDPLTLATLLLARGSSAVLASTSEVADDPVAARYVNSILYRLPETSMPQAVREATARLLTRQAHRDGYLSRWAPIVTVGVPMG